jgi:hypothetical protein
MLSKILGNRPSLASACANVNRPRSQTAPIFSKRQGALATQWSLPTSLQRLASSSKPRSRLPPQKKPTNFLTGLRVCSIFVLCPVLKEKADLSGSVESVPPAAACDRSVGRGAARLAKAVRKEPIVGLSGCGVPVAGIAARRGLTAKRARRQMAPQRLEKVESAPGNGMASAAQDPQYLVQAPGQAPSSRTIPVAPRRMAEATSDRRGGRLSAAPRRAAQSCTKWRPRR